jgi:hypothetical protein
LRNPCLDDVRARAKRGGWGPLAPQIEFLPKGFLASEALEQYLKRWKLLDDGGARACALCLSSPLAQHLSSLLALRHHHT